MMDGSIKQKEIMISSYSFFILCGRDLTRKEETETKQDPVELVGQILSHYLFVGK